MAAPEWHRNRMRIMIGQDTQLWLYNIYILFCSVSRSVRPSSNIKLLMSG